MFREPPRSPYDLNFSLFGFPVRVHYMFWIVMLIFGIIGPSVADMRQQLIVVACWVAAAFLSILVHELGHAFVQRWYGFAPHIVLYSFGGLAIPGPAREYARREPGPWGNILISFMGPGAGFLLATLILGACVAAGTGLHAEWLWLHARYSPEFGVDAGVHAISLSTLEPLPYVMFTKPPTWSPYVALFLSDLIWISIAWGFLNLLPVYPLDGGHISREVCLMLDYREGIRRSLWISIGVAGAIALLALLQWLQLPAEVKGFPFRAMLFGYLGYMSYQTLQVYNFRRWD